MSVENIICWMVEVKIALGVLGIITNDADYNIYIYIYIFYFFFWAGNYGIMFSP